MYCTLILLKERLMRVSNMLMKPFWIFHEFVCFLFHELKDRSKKLFLCIWYPDQNTGDVGRTLVSCFMLSHALYIMHVLIRLSNTENRFLFLQSCFTYNFMSIIITLQTYQQLPKDVKTEGISVFDRTRGLFW